MTELYNILMYPSNFSRAATLFARFYAIFVRWESGMYSKREGGVRLWGALLLCHSIAALS